MSENTKLDPATLSATEKVECPNCGQPTEESPDRPLFNDHLCQYPCQPAQPEPAAQGKMPEAVYIAANTLRASGHVTLADALLKEAWHLQPVAVGMSGALERVLDCAEMDANRDRMGGHETTADRTMAAIREVRQQAAQGKPKVELPCPFCGAAPEVSRPSGRSEWIPESAGLGSAGWSGPVTEASCRACGVMRVPLVIWNRRTHSQPVAVGMTEELSMVLLRAEYGATEDERNPNLRDGYVARLKDAIAAVRQQAAQGKPKVELPNVREGK